MVVLIFFRDLITVDTDAQSGLSSRRFVLVMAGMSLSIATIILTIAAAFGNDVEMPLWAVTTPLTALAGGAYITKRDHFKAASTKMPEEAKNIYDRPRQHMPTPHGPITNTYTDGDITSGPHRGY